MADLQNLDHIEDEDALESLIAQTDDIDLKRRIRRRQKNIREKRQAAYETDRQARLQQHSTEDAVTMKLRRAAEDKQRKLRDYDERARQQKQDIGSAEKALRLRHAEADEEKQRKLQQFKDMGRIMSSVYNLGVNDLLKKNQPASNTDVNSINFLAPRAVGNIHGFGGTAYSAKGDAQISSQQGSANRGGLARNPNTIKQVLLDWAKAQVAGYENVNVTNFSTSWSDGLAFCALIHHFYPNAFDFKKLAPKNRRGNFTLAFDTAEKQADIAPLLDVEDMVRMKNPDWKCVFTYVQSFYQRFAVKNQQ